MENLETIIELLYKRTSIQKVIDERLKSNNFDQKEFMRMMTAYVFHYSENEFWNLLNYFLDTFQESAEKKGRKISSKLRERELNVFEPLFYYAQEFLVIRDNEILCKYSRLMEWRKITIALSEELIIAAFLASELTQSDMRMRGYAWKTVIGHDNAQLNAIIHRGISENHSHLNGAAPIFQISWLSLMNNVNSAQLGGFLRNYDRERRYTNVAYDSLYRETSFFEKYMQAALIRLLLFCKICGKRFKIGNYEVSTLMIGNHFLLPEFKTSQMDKELCLNYTAACRILNILTEDREDGDIKNQWKKYSLRRVIICVIESCMDLVDWEEIWQSNLILKELLESTTGECVLDGYQIAELVKDNFNVPLSKFFKKLLFLIDRISLKDIQKLFSDKEVYESIWEEKTLENVKKLLHEPEELIHKMDYVQSMIDTFRLGEKGYTQEYKKLDYILNYLKNRGLAKETDNFIFSGERWLMYTMLRKIYLNDIEYMEYFNLFYAYLLIKECIRSELIQSNKNVGFKNFQKYQDRKGDLLADAIYGKEFTRLAVSNSLVSESICKIELRVVPEKNTAKLYRQIQRLDQIVLPDDTWKKNLFYTVHFIKECEKLQDDVIYTYCRHDQKRKDIEKRAHALIGLREKFPHVGERILGIDAAANEIGCRPEVFAPMFRYLKNHRYRYYTADGMMKLPQLGVTYHVGEDFLDLADGLRAIEEAILFLNLESGDRLGHALALGLDAKEWYQAKRNRIVLPIQDYLDNLVWIFHKIMQYDIHGFENLKEWIRGEYTVLFGRLYKENMRQGDVDAIFQEFLNKTKEKGNSGYYEGDYNRMDMGIFNYYNAWKLRGDDPKLYELGYFDVDYCITRKEEFRANFHYLKDLKSRRIPEAAILYFMYHFNRKVREDGAKTIEVSVSSNYVECVVIIQKIMQKEIAQKGIAIETNPSSNFLIGTFRQYEKHPIIQFYNKGLVYDLKKIQDCPQLLVSINTDDQGVFSTSLENEYALMACALESVKDEDGNYVYNKSDIYEWLDRIRIMGNEQSFGWNYEKRIGKIEARYYDED